MRRIHNMAQIQGEEVSDTKCHQNRGKPASSTAPVFGRVGKRGPAEVRTVVAEDAPIHDARIRSSPLRVERQALRPLELARPLDLGVSQLVLGVPGERLECVCGEGGNVMRLETSYAHIIPQIHRVPCQQRHHEQSKTREGRHNLVESIVTMDVLCPSCSSCIDLQSAEHGCTHKEDLEC